MKKTDLQDKVTKQNKIEKADICIFLIVFIIFGFALLSFFPAILTSDCTSQIKQAENNSYSLGHPVIHTFIIGNLSKLGGVWVPALFQIIVFATIWTWGCKVARSDNKTLKNKIFQVIVTTIISFIPLNFLYSITLWKDILYSYSFLAMLVCIFIGIKKDFKYSIVEIILASLSIICVMKFRYNGAAVGILMFIILLLLNFVKQRKVKISILFICTLIIFNFIISLPQKILIEKSQNNSNIGSVGGAFNGTILHTMGALLNTDISLNQDEIEFLNSILDIDEWKEKYTPYTASSIHYNPSLRSEIFNTKQGNKKLKQIFIKLVKQHPKETFMHFARVNSIWWSISEKAGMHSVVLSNDWIHEIENGRYDTHPIIQKGNEILIKYTNKTMSHTKIYKLIYRPAIAIIVSIICIIAIVFKNKRKNIWYILILLPMLLNIGTYIPLITSQDQRYFYPCFMTQYYIIILFANVFFTNKINYNENNKQKSNIENPKTLVIIPAYNESESIQKVVNSVYEQKLEGLDVIVINDGSKDNTLEEAKKTKAIVLDLPSNLGIGGAVQSGYLYAYKNNYDIAIQIDGDGQHNPRYIENMIKILSQENVDMVIGSRFISKTQYDQTFMRMLGINITSLIIKIFTEKKIYDTTSGYRAINKDIIKEFVNSYPYDYPEPVTTMQMILKGKNIKEIPVEMRKRQTGVSFITPLKSASYMIKVTLSLLLNSFRK